MSPTSASVALLLLAAGASSRMRGRDKLLETVNGEPMLAHIAKRAIATGQEVFVTLPVDATLRRDALNRLDLKIIDVLDAQTGMAASLRAWAQTEYSNFDGVMVILTDMPDLTTADLSLLCQVFQNTDCKNVIRATDSNGHPGHPVLFPQRLVPQFAEISGDQGARDLLRGEDVTFVPLPGTHATTDLDTPEDWAAWRNTHNNRP